LVSVCDKTKLGKGEKMNKTVLMVGAFDTKGSEYAFLWKQILDQGVDVLTMNTGVLGSTALFPVDIEAAEVAKARGGNIKILRKKKDRGEAMQIMSAGVAILTKSLFEKGSFDGIIGMGGTGGTAVVTSAMRAVPVRVPKVCVSTVASGDTSPYVAGKNITMIPSIVDVAGINRISRVIFSQAAGAICGMVKFGFPSSTEDKPIIAATMFGNTTECVDDCVKSLSVKGYEVLVFHATGIGGKTMESLVQEGLIDAVLDITTTEWADTICGGIFGAGMERLSAPGEMGVPHLIVPGCVDMVNFGPPGTVPQKYKDANRKFYEWNPSTTLMRTSIKENKKMGEIFAEKANRAKGPVAFLIPLQGVSILDGNGQLFCDRDADKAMFRAIKSNLRRGIPVIEMDNNINDPEFAAKAVEIILDLMTENRK